MELVFPVIVIMKPTKWSLSFLFYEEQRGRPTAMICIYVHGLDLENRR